MYLHGGKLNKYCSSSGKPNIFALQLGASIANNMLHSEYIRQFDFLAKEEPTSSAADYVSVRKCLRRTANDERRTNINYYYQLSPMLISTSPGYRHCKPPLCCLQHSTLLLHRSLQCCPSRSSMRPRSLSSIHFFSRIVNLCISYNHRNERGGALRFFFLNVQYFPHRGSIILVFQTVFGLLAGSNRRGVKVLCLQQSFVVDGLHLAPVKQTFGSCCESKYAV
jgi:hypothetical protein